MTPTERHAVQQARARTALRRGKQTSIAGIREELEHAYERIRNGPDAEKPIWEQVAHDLERVLAHRGGVRGGDAGASNPLPGL